MTDESVVTTATKEEGGREQSVPEPAHSLVPGSAWSAADPSGRPWAPSLVPSAVRSPAKLPRSMMKPVLGWAQAAEPSRAP